jgi:GNAT superfamily N-acetyltransferase
LGVIAYRNARAADATMVSALAMQVFLDTYAAEGVRPDLAREALSQYCVAAFEERIAESDRRFILALRGDGLIAFAETVVAMRASPIAGVEGAELVRLYVQPPAQRSGIGRALLGRCESLAKDASLRALWLTAWEGNARALAFYRHLQYRDVGATTYAFEGNTYGNRVLAKRLEA